MSQAKKMEEENLRFLNKKKRGTNNELEVIMVIISENHSLKKRVLDKLKILKGQAVMNQRAKGRSV